MHQDCMRVLKLSLPLTSLLPHFRAYFIIISSAVPFRYIPTSYLAKDKYNEILSPHRYGRCARPWSFSRLRSGKSSPCDTQYDSLAQYCGNKDIWRISSCVYGILPYCKQSFREDERRNFASGVYILGGFDELLLPSLLYPFFPHANARCTRFRFFHSSAFSRESLRSLV